MNNTSSIPTTMLVLVGEQRIPNSIPVRQFPNSMSCALCSLTLLLERALMSTRHTNKKVEMVYSKFTEPAATHLKAWLNTQGVKVYERPELMPTNEVNDFNVQRNIVQTILSDYSQGEIFLNLTGGTKIMALAAAEIARDFCPTIYVDTENESFWWVHPTPRKEPLKVSLTVEDFFRLHGQPWNPTPPPSPAEQSVARTLAADFERLEPLLRYLQKQADGQSFTRRSLSKMEQDFLKMCENARILVITTSQTVASSATFSWRMNRARFFSQNDWLECLAFAACRDAGFDDVQWKIPVIGTETDLDVAATRGPLMVVCSCKSGSIKNSHLDELDAQARLVGGTFCKKAILRTEAIAFSRRQDKHAVTQARAKLESRAKTLRIQPFYWTDYPDLGQKMRALLSTGRR